MTNMSSYILLNVGFSCLFAFLFPIVMRPKVNYFSSFVKTEAEMNARWLPLFFILAMFTEFLT